MNRIMRNSGAALAAIFIAGSLTACGPGSASSSRSDTNPTEVSTDLGNKKYELTLWDGAGLKAVDEALIARPAPAAPSPRKARHSAAPPLRRVGVPAASSGFRSTLCRFAGRIRCWTVC